MAKLPGAIRLGIACISSVIMIAAARYASGEGNRGERYSGCN